MFSGLIDGVLRVALHYVPYHDVDVVGKSELMTSRVAYDIFSDYDISRPRETLTGMRRESIYAYVLLRALEEGRSDNDVHVRESWSGGSGIHDSSGTRRYGRQGRPLHRTRCSAPGVALKVAPRPTGATLALRLENAVERDLGARLILYLILKGAPRLSTAPSSYFPRTDTDPSCTTFNSYQWPFLQSRHGQLHALRS